MKALFEHEQEFFDRLSEFTQKHISKAGISTVHDLAVAIRDKKMVSDEVVLALQAINFVHLPDPEEL